MTFGIRVERLVSVVITASLTALYYHHYYARWTLLGRTAYLTHEAARFDNYLADGGWFLPIYQSVILATFFFIAYELINFLLAKFFGKPLAEKEQVVE